MKSAAPSRMSNIDEFVAVTAREMPALTVHPLDHALSLDRPEGLVLELGVYTGSSIAKIASANPDATVYGFDSFEGLPESWGRPDANYDQGVFSLQKKLPRVPANVRLIAGWFDETLPKFASEHAGETISFLHIDCDIYSSTRCVFEHLGPMLRSGSIIVFDELLNYPTFEKHEIKAFFEWLSATDRRVDWLGKIGPVIANPLTDNGYYDQPAACRLL
jgi:predicted O-methyltransferase YrrM